MTTFDENKALIETAEKEAENKTQNKKALKGFVPIIIAAGIVGLLAGLGIIYAQEHGLENDIAGFFSEIVFHVCPWAVIISGLVGMIAAGTMIKKARGIHKAAVAEAEDGELDEEKTGEIDRILNNALYLQSIAQTVQFMFFGMFMVNLIDYIWIISPFVTIAAVIFFMAAIFIEIKQQQMIVDLVKLINPSKDGSVYDVKFQQKWEESCDEMEQMQIYKSAYKAYKAGVLTCVILWVLFALSGMLFQSGVLPIGAVSVIWLVMTISYMAEARRLEHGK